MTREEERLQVCFPLASFPKGKWGVQLSKGHVNDEGRLGYCLEQFFLAGQTAPSGPAADRLSGPRSSLGIPQDHEMLRGTRSPAHAAGEFLKMEKEDPEIWGYNIPAASLTARAWGRCGHYRSRSPEGIPSGLVKAQLCLGRQPPCDAASVPPLVLRAKVCFPIPGCIFLYPKITPSQDRPAGSSRAHLSQVRGELAAWLVEGWAPAPFNSINIRSAAAGPSS
uniref:Uncharacterized protein n=1 Tax=Sphaerodactylus townsendi TaxID=933632 RepID=A0ACB8EF48_9SAUR